MILSSLYICYSLVAAAKIYFYLLLINENLDLYNLWITLTFAISGIIQFINFFTKASRCNKKKKCYIHILVLYVLCNWFSFPPCVVTPQNVQAGPALHGSDKEDFWVWIALCFAHFWWSISEHFMQSHMIRFSYSVLFRLIISLPSTQIYFL